MPPATRLCRFTWRAVRSRLCALVGLLPCTLCLLLSSPARAEELSEADKEAARTQVFEGDRAFAERDFARALARYSAAYRLVRVPSIGIEVARATAALGHLLDAYRLALEVVELPKRPVEAPVITRARTDAAALARELVERMPTLRLDITPLLETLRIQIDGSPIQQRALRIDPGRHRVLVRADGYHSFEQELVLAERETQVLRVALARDLPSATQAAPAQTTPAQAAVGGAATPAASHPTGAADQAARNRRSAAFVVLGVGALNVAVGGISGLVAFYQKPDCPGNQCPPQRKGDLAASKRAGDIANVGFGLGAVLAIIGGSLLITPDAAPPSASALHLDLEGISRGAALKATGSF